MLVFWLLEEGLILRTLFFFFFWPNENDEICITIEVASEGKVLICPIWLLFSPRANNYCGEEIPHCFKRINRA